MEEQSDRIDEAASNACTRSGAFVLLLSVVLWLLIPFWLDKPNEIALGRYLTYRFNLALKSKSILAS
jgi:hypothetical protein